MLLLSVCLLAILSLGATQECSILQEGELEGTGGLISGVLSVGEAEPLAVAVNDFRIVCLASGSVRDRYRFVSVVVDYSCVGTPSCSRTTDQFDFQCESGSWVAVIFGDSANTQGTPATGTLSTMLRTDCSFCFGPSVAEANPFSLLQPGTTADAETHCVPCDFSCIGPEDNGLGLCTGTGSDSCCNVFVNNMCMVECPTGFELLNRECVISCGPLPDITNGSVVLTTTFVNSTATYECDPGFTLSEDVTRTCLDSGIWSMDEPTCIIVDCGVLDPPENGDVSHPTTTFGSIATYSCEPGFELDGNEQRMCQANGMWDGSDPACDDLCEGVNCVNGNCITGSCVCLPGYTGTLCDVNLDPCNNVPCVNGICSEGICTCNAGFTGPPCVCECASAGRCTTNGSMCVCNEFYSGPPFCNTCACESAGRCTTGSAPDFECVCTAMYFGPPSCSEPLVLELRFINDSPDVQGNNISASIQFSRPVDTLRCSLTGIPYQDCASGSVIFTNVPPRENNRPYILKVEGETTNGVRTVIRRLVRIEQPNICTVQLINDGVTVDGNSATIQFSSRGPAVEFLCSLDQQPLQPCSMTQTFSGLSVGDHRVKIVPDGCGRNRQPLVVRFTVEEVDLE